MGETIAGDDLQKWLINRSIAFVRMLAPTKSL